MHKTYLELLQFASVPEICIVKNLVVVFIVSSTQHMDRIYIISVLVFDPVNWNKNGWNSAYWFSFFLFPTAMLQSNKNRSFYGCCQGSDQQISHFPCLRDTDCHSIADLLCHLN